MRSASGRASDAAVAAVPARAAPALAGLPPPASEPAPALAAAAPPVRRLFAARADPNNGWEAASWDPCPPTDPAELRGLAAGAGTAAPVHLSMCWFTTAWITRALQSGHVTNTGGLLCRFSFSDPLAFLRTPAMATMRRAVPMRLRRACRVRRVISRAGNPWRSLAPAPRNANTFDNRRAGIESGILHLVLLRACTTPLTTRRPLLQQARQRRTAFGVALGSPRGSRTTRRGSSTGPVRHVREAVTGPAARLGAFHEQPPRTGYRRS